MPQLKTEALIDCLENMRIRLYELYVYTLDIEMGDALLNESNKLNQIISQLKKLLVKPA